jgi:uncharacterized protein YbjT (DUF2867 family)
LVIDMHEGAEHSPQRHPGIITVLGGTGFLGRRIVRHLLGQGFDVRAASRHPERVAALFAADDAGPEAVRVDVRDEGSVAIALTGARTAVNAVSLYVERGRETFQAVHVEAAASVAWLARKSGLDRLIHVSGIGAAAGSSSRYIAARGEGEVVVRQAFPDATLIRPAVMFGPDDAFLTTLVKLIRTLPVYPLFGRGETRLQPVHVEDVAEAIARLLQDATGGGPFCYELGGPRIYTYAELVRSIAGRIGAHTRLVPMPFALWEALALMAELVPGAPLTRDQVALMRHDNVASSDLPGLSALGIQPMAIEDIAATIAGGDTARD